MCDSIVYGRMPGKGRRVWQASQFRFRVVYSVPQIRLHSIKWRDRPALVSDDDYYYLNELPELAQADEDLSVKRWFRMLERRWYWQRHHLVHFFRRLMRRHWRNKDSELGTTVRVRVEETSRGRIISRHRGRRAHKRSYSNERLLLTNDGFNSGEASWVTFCRTVQPHCRESMTYDLVEGDADRCPPDRPVVPMQISLRDIIVMAFKVGMEVTSAAFGVKMISMQGSAGTITSAQHPILGSLIHSLPLLICTPTTEYQSLRWKAEKQESSNDKGSVTYWRLRLFHYIARDYSHHYQEFVRNKIQEVFGTKGHGNLKCSPSLWPAAK